MCLSLPLELGQCNTIGHCWTAFFIEMEGSILVCDYTSINGNMITCILKLFFLFFFPSVAYSSCLCLVSNDWWIKNMCGDHWKTFFPPLHIPFIFPSSGWCPEPRVGPQHLTVWLTEMSTPLNVNHFIISSDRLKKFLL